MASDTGISVWWPLIASSRIGLERFGGDRPFRGGDVVGKQLRWRVLGEPSNLLNWLGYHRSVWSARHGAALIAQINGVICTAILLGTTRQLERWSSNLKARMVCSAYWLKTLLIHWLMAQSWMEMRSISEKSAWCTFRSHLSFACPGGYSQIKIPEFGKTIRIIALSSPAMSSISFTLGRHPMWTFSRLIGLWPVMITNLVLVYCNCVFPCRLNASLFVIM